MVRTQVRLTHAQAQAVKRLAKDRAAPMAEIIRQSIDEYLRGLDRPDEQELRRHALSIIGMVGEGPSDVSVRHDDYPAEAYE